ncbi:hypothetical protein HDA32_004518 [Spinactinospora alkalitolerans]|uniref:Lipase n=1 Tax=Spinactinospora alkalitolerans TaxID=687207 RepID=A0A852TZP9_9ACTN|nr:hypothetical protein [Spinactinospora alkalitolerans]NYE49398.1 hypothetical protein [Spinactinospora alkalitolerans]
MPKKPKNAAVLRGPGIVAGALAAGLALTLSTAPALAGTAPAAIPESPGEGFRFTLPEPTGRHDVGTVELHLVDEDRADPWNPERARELMVSIWYPAKGGRGHERARYAPSGTAAALDAEVAPQLGLEPGDLDIAGVRTAARTGVPADRRLGERPVVLFSPGGGVSRTLGTALVQDLASRGYVVVTVDHTGEAPVEFPGGRVEGVRYDAEDPHLYRDLMDARVRDTRFLLDELETIEDGGNPDAEGRRLPPGLGRILDLSEIGMFGHSAGGSAAAHTMHEDRRVDAGIDMDGSISFGAPGSQQRADFEERFPVAQRGLDRPFMLMGGSGEKDPENPGADPAHTHETFDDWAALWDNSTGWKLDVNFPEARHFSFTDHLVALPRIREEFDLDEALITPAIGTVDDPARMHRSQRAYVAAFFDEHLRHRPQPLLDAESPEHPDARFIP